MPSKAKLLLGALLAVGVSAPALGQAGYPSPSSYPGRPAYRTQSGGPVTRRPVPLPTPTPVAPDESLAGQVDYVDPVPSGEQSPVPAASDSYPQRPAPVPGTSYPQRTAPATRDGPPPEVQRAAGPTATSGAARFDEVGRIGGWAGQPTGAAVVMAHPTLPAGTFVEVTSLDTGRTIAAVVVAEGGGSVGDLSPGGMTQLGVEPGAPVRVRAATPPPPDQNALRSGQPANARMTAPPGLLVALRQQLAQRGGGRAPVAARAAPAAPRGTPSRPAATAGTSYDRPERAAAPVVRPARAPTTAARGRWFVQVAALSSATRARALAGQLGGRVVAAGAVYRVQAGPYADAAAARRARDGIARRGYGDARVVAGN